MPIGFEKTSYAIEVPITKGLTKKVVTIAKVIIIFNVIA
ncbi:Unknown protein sequence [Pseudomonas syringae pv. maculicola]|nr:Unknown protein sequence [Pseudomonas syringae pv. maculicola]